MPVPQNRFGKQGKKKEITTQGGAEAEGTFLQPGHEISHYWYIRAEGRDSRFQ